MNTIAWLFVFGGVLIIRFVSKGRGITDIPGDIGDIITGALTNDPKKIKDVLGRGNDVATPLDFSGVASGVGDIAGGVNDLGSVSLTDKSSRYPLGNVDKKLIPIANAVGTKFAIKTIIGVRANKGGYGDAEHASGKAIDIFVPDKNIGDAVASYLIAHPAQFNIKYVIWYQRIWYPGSGWRAMPDRGSDNNNHKNHVHLSVN